MADTQNTHASPPQYLFYRRLVAYTVYTICGLLFLWSVASVTIQTFYPEYRPPAVTKPVPPKAGTNVTADAGKNRGSQKSHEAATKSMGATAPSHTSPASDKPATR